MINIAIEKCHVYLIYMLNKVIFHSFVRLPEGTTTKNSFQYLISITVALGAFDLGVSFNLDFLSGSVGAVAICTMVGSSLLICHP